MTTVFTDTLTIQNEICGFRYNNKQPRRLPSANNFDPRATEDRLHSAEREALFAEVLRKVCLNDTLYMGG